MTPLPRIMVAPNGARRGKADHPALPITDDELVDTTRACIAAGADGVHLHLRDGNGKHLLDAARYRFLLERLEAEVPGAYLQVTSEAAGIYDAPAQRAMMRALKPRYVSVALREMSVSRLTGLPPAISITGPRMPASRSSTSSIRRRKCKALSSRWITGEFRVGIIWCSWCAAPTPKVQTGRCRSQITCANSARPPVTVSTGCYAASALMKPQVLWKPCALAARSGSDSKTRS